MWSSCIMNILGVLANAYFSASRQAVFSLVRMRICLNPNPYFPAVTTATDTPAHFVTLRVVPTLYTCTSVLPFTQTRCFKTFHRLSFSDNSIIGANRGQIAEEFNHFPFLSDCCSSVRPSSQADLGIRGKTLGIVFVNLYSRIRQYLLNPIKYQQMQTLGMLLHLSVLLR